MDYGRFIVCGKDRKLLSHIKDTLAANGHIFIGYTKELSSLIRHVRGCSPDFIIIEVSGSFNELRNTLEVIDSDLLSACILVLNVKDEQVYDFFRGTRVMNFLIKPVFDEVLLQIVDNSLMNFKRIMEYEERMRKLSNTLESRKAVEKAKWILVEQRGYSESEAYEVIRKKSRDSRIPMRDIADALILRYQTADNALESSRS